MKRALFFTAFDRPGYLARVLETWEGVRGLDRWHIVARIEPGQHTDQIRAMFEKFFFVLGLNDVDLVVNKSKLGVLHHPWVGFETLFSRYDFVVRTEDDLLVSSDVLELFEWASKTFTHDQSIATVHGFSLGDGGDLSAMFRSPGFNPLVFGTWRDRWEQLLSPTWDHDYSTFNGTPGNQCVPVRTEILTQRGWLNHSEVRVGDYTIGYNDKKERSEWTRILGVVHPFEAPTVSIFGQHKGFECTLDHKWWVETKSRRTGSVRRKLVKTEDLSPQSRVMASVRAETGPGLPITDQEAALLGWVAGDGSVVVGPANKDGSRKLKLSVSQKKSEWFPEIERVFAGIPHSVYYYRGVRTWCLSTAYARGLLERAGHPKEDSFRQVLGMSPSQRREWLSAMDAAEGTDHGHKRRIYQCCGQISDAIQLAIYLEGWKSTRSSPVHKGGWRPYHAHSFGVPLPQAKVPRESGVQEVWCVRTELGSWTARQDDLIMLTGNSGWDWNLNTRVYPREGLGGIYPEVSRVRNIGVHGTHSTPENYYDAQVFSESVPPQVYRQLR